MGTALLFSRDFVYVRVDLFLNEDEVVFRELMFAPDAWRSGMFLPSAVNNVLGYMVAHPEAIDHQAVEGVLPAPANAQVPARARCPTAAVFECRPW